MSSRLGPKKMTRKQLNAALKKATKAATTLFQQKTLIDEHCSSVYGLTPGDVDNDHYIDATGGSGIDNAMSVDDFEDSMKRAIAIHVSSPKRKHIYD